MPVATGTILVNCRPESAWVQSPAMATREDVIDAIKLIERAGYQGEATKTAQAQLLLPLSAQQYDAILQRLLAACPQVFAPLPAPVDDVVQLGAAAAAMKKAEAALSQQLSATAEFDRQVLEALLHANKTTREGRQKLEDLESQIESVLPAWNLSTAVGARELQRFLTAKLGQIITVVEDANDDDASKRALAAAWAALYASQADGDSSEPAPVGSPDTPAATVAPEPLGETDIGSYPDLFADDELLPGDLAPQPGVAPVAPAPPGMGGEAPGGLALPAAGLPTGLPLSAIPQGLQSALAAPLGDADAAGSEPTEQDTFDGVDEDQSGADGEAAAAAPEPDGPTAVTLPNGERITAATPQLAAVIEAAAGGTPIAEAFRQQGIVIPPPGTAVTGPLDQSRLIPGDIGMFTDRHALALGNDTALLDGQIQHTANVTGPSFLGWQHPPVPVDQTATTQTPTPTQLSATVLRR